MSLKKISKIADEFAELVEGLNEDTREDAPEIWCEVHNPLYIEEYYLNRKSLDTVKGYTAAGTPEEARVFSRLYAATKEIIEQGLIPTDSDHEEWNADCNLTKEVTRVLENNVAELLVAIAEKNPAVGAEIVKDLKSGYASASYRDPSGLSAKVAGRIQAVETSPPAKKPAAPKPPSP